MQIDFAQTPTQFQENQFIVLRQVLKDPVLQMIKDYYRVRHESGSLDNPDTQVKNSPAKYADPLAETLLLRVKPIMEKATGLKLFPTYTYMRVYLKGATLEAHKDRPSCEISTTLCVDADTSVPWPIFVRNSKGDVAKIFLESGDMLIYRGCDCEHWREPFQGEKHVQIFLHFVDQNGPHAEWKFDKRPSVGSKSS